LLENFPTSACWAYFGLYYVVFFIRKAPKPPKEKKALALKEYSHYSFQEYSLVFLLVLLFLAEAFFFG
jgi:hypothetical protein